MNGQPVWVELLERERRRVARLDSRADWRLVQVKRLREKLADARQETREVRARCDEQIRHFQDVAISARLEARRLEREVARLAALLADRVDA